MKLTNNFNLSEFIHSNSANKIGIDNKPDDKVIENLKHLTTNLLQPLRNLYNEPLHINSGYRSKALNSAVGGVATSQHLHGEAADISCSSPKRLLEVLKSSGLSFDQAILYPTFLHLSLKKISNRGQIIIKSLLCIVIFCSCSKPIYLQGKTEYKERVVVKDTTIYVEIKSLKVETQSTDSSYLEVEMASSLAFVDTMGNLHHNIVQKPQKIETKVEYIEKIVTIHDSIPYPQIVTQIKEVKRGISFGLMWVIIAVATIVAWRVARLFK